MDGTAGFLNVLDFGAAGDGKADDTGAFQEALDSAGKRGGVVYAPPGNYMFEGRLNVPISVTLMGSFNFAPAHTGIRDGGDNPKPGDFGTVFLVRSGRGTEEGEAFISLGTNSTLKGVCVYYPDQAPDRAPAPYPYCVSMRGSHPAIMDVELLNPYNGIDARENSRHYIARVYGQPLRRGIFVDRIYDIGRIEDVHFNPWWSLDPAVTRFMIGNGEAFILGRTDWEYMVNCFSFHYKTGYLCKDFGDMGPNVMFTQCGHDNGVYSVVVEETTPWAGLSFNNCQLMGEFLVKETNKGPVRVSNCGFWTSARGTFENPGTKSHVTINGEGHVSVNNCHFSNFNKLEETLGEPCVTINGKSASVTGCDFLEGDKPHVHIGDSVKGAVIKDNKFTGRARISGNLSVAKIADNIEV